MSDSSSCQLCEQPGGEVLYRNGHLRIVLVDDADYPGFCRVIWNAHVAEMSDLAQQERDLLMSAVFVVEQAIREVICPDKINLASLGNVVPHLHWHVIPRHGDDRHFPAPIWAEARREPSQERLAVRAALLPELKRLLAGLAAHLPE